MYAGTLFALFTNSPFLYWIDSEAAPASGGLLVINSMALYSIWNMTEIMNQGQGQIDVILPWVSTSANEKAGQSGRKSIKSGS